YDKARREASRTSAHTGGAFESTRSRPIADRAFGSAGHLAGVYSVPLRAELSTTVSDPPDRESSLRGLRPGPLCRRARGGGTAIEAAEKPQNCHSARAPTILRGYGRELAGRWPRRGWQCRR